MDLPDTNPVDMDRELLTRLRTRHPEKSESELLESVAIIMRGDEALAEIRAAFADVPEEKIEREAVKAVKEVRRERAAARQTAAPRADFGPGD